MCVFLDNYDGEKILKNRFLDIWYVLKIFNEYFRYGIYFWKNGILPGCLFKKLPVANLRVTHSIGTISHFLATKAVSLTTLTKAVFNPAWFKSWNTLAVVAVLIAALPSRAWDLTPSPAVMRSLLWRRHNVGSSTSSKTCFVLPSIMSFPVFNPKTQI